MRKKYVIVIESVCYISIILFCQVCKPNIPMIAVLKWTSHPALDELEKSFVSTLQKAMDEKLLPTLKIETFNADGNGQRAKSLAEVITKSNVKLIIAIATPAAQAVANTPSNVPFLYGAVADPRGAGIIPSERASGIRNVGENIIRKAILFIKTAFPETKKIGSLYNPSEQNSVYVQSLIAKICKENGLELVQQSVRGNAEIASLVQILATKVDLIYSANDNTINSSVATVVGVCNSLKKPFILGDLSTLSKGAFAAVGLHYGSMGEEIAQIAIKILNGSSVKSFPPQDPPNPEIWINIDSLEKNQFHLTEDAIKMASRKIRNMD